MLSEVFPVQNTVAFLENFVSFESQVELFTQITHVKQLFVVFLKQTRSKCLYTGVIMGYVKGIVAKGHHTIALLTYILHERTMLAIRQE
jgi:hypothetical protein